MRIFHSLYLLVVHSGLSSAFSFSLVPRQLGNLVDGVLDTVSGLTNPLFDAAGSWSLPGKAILDPLLDMGKQILSGQGLVQGALGPLEDAIGEEQGYDYVVVEGGTAGIPVAVRLAQAGFTVAVIEAGLFHDIGKPVLGSTPAGAFFGIGASPLDQLPTVDWGFITEPQAGANDRSVHYARGKAVGGSSTTNFMIHQRGTTASYDLWAAAAGDNSYRLANLMPFFQRSVTFTPPDSHLRRANATTLYDTYAFSNQDGPIQVGDINWVSVLATWLEVGLRTVGLYPQPDFCSGSLLGYHYSQSTIRSSDQTRSAANQYLSLIHNDHLKVYTETMAKRILFEGNVAVGVRVATLNLLEYTIHARREVILCAGAFQTPQMLMVSGVGPRYPLEELGIPIVCERPGVGQNLMDHILFGPSYEVNYDTVDRFLHDPIVLAEALADCASVPPTGPLTSNVIELIGWEKVPQHLRQFWSLETQLAMSSFPPDWPEIEFLTGNGYVSSLNFPVLQQPLNGRQYITILGAMVATTSRGNITIPSKDSHVPPIINPNWLTTKADQEVAVSFFRRMREIALSTPMLTTIITQSDGDPEYFPGSGVQTDEEILDIIRSTFMTVWHASGTARMGRVEDAFAVVDNLARVIGVQKLRVVDASIFPILPPGHIQSTVYALAEKIADVILRGY